MRGLGRLALRRPRAIVAAFALLSLVLGWGATRLQLDASVLALLPEGDEVTELQAEIGRTFGTDAVMVALVDRRTKQVVHGLDPARQGAVSRLGWVSDRRLFVMSSRVYNGVEQAYLEPAIVAIDGFDEMPTDACGHKSTPYCITCAPSHCRDCAFPAAGAR